MLEPTTQRKESSYKVPIPTPVPAYTHFSEKHTFLGVLCVTLIPYLKVRKKNKSKEPTCPAENNH